jgi:hypothetical protein
MGRKRYFSSLLGSAEKPLLLPLCGRKGEGARLVMGRMRDWLFPYEEGKKRRRQESEI